jgi:hypothetical protein
MPIHGSMKVTSTVGWKKIIYFIVFNIAIVLGSFWLGTYYGVTTYGDFVSDLQHKYDVMHKEVETFTKVSDPKTVRKYVKELNRILLDINFLADAIESGQLADEYITGLVKSQEKIKDLIKNLQDNNVRYDMTIQRLIYNVNKNSEDVANNLDFIDSLKQARLKELAYKDVTFRNIMIDLKQIKKDIKLLQRKKLFHQHHDTTRSSNWITNILTRETE